MSATVLTKKQQRLSLSAKKTPVKSIRHVLAQPRESFWPLLKETKAEAIETILKETLPALEKKVTKIPWSQLRKMTKEERLGIRSKKQADGGNTISRNVIMGINAVTRALEKDAVCSVLLDSSIDPLLLIKHVITMAQLKRVPILLLPSLKKLAFDSFGFGCAAFSIKKQAMCPENHFYKLHEKIVEIFSEFESTCEVTMKSEHPMETEEPLQGCRKLKISSDPYKYRKSRNERAFIPGRTEKVPDTSVVWSDFIGIDKDVDVFDRSEVSERYVNVRKGAKSKGNKLKTDCPVYKPLKVKRLRGNPNRKKITKSANVKR